MEKPASSAAGGDPLSIPAGSEHSNGFDKDKAAWKKLKEDERLQAKKRRAREVEKEARRKIQEAKAKRNSRGQNRVVDRNTTASGAQDRLEGSEQHK